MADEHDEGPSDPAKVRATITATATTEADGTAAFPLPNPQPVTLYRAIEALGGSETTSFGEGWNTAIFEALTILTERGFTEQADAINPERFDVTKRPEVEILLAGRHDLMVEIEKLGKELMAESADVHWVICYDAAQLLDRLGAYILGQDTRLIAAGEALAEANRMVDTAQGQTAKAIALADDFRERVIRLSREVEGLKGDVRAAEAAWEDEHSKRERAERLLGEQTVRTTELEIRLEGAVFALRHGMNEGVEASAAMFSPSTSLIDYLAAPLDGTKPKIPARGLYGDETIVVGVEDLRETIRHLGPLFKDDREEKLSAAVERLFMSAGLLPERHYKPRFRVVTSPRFYSDGDVAKAAEYLAMGSPVLAQRTDEYRETVVEIVAVSLGMRKAKS